MIDSTRASKWNDKCPLVGPLTVTTLKQHRWIEQQDAKSEARRQSMCSILLWSAQLLQLVTVHPERAPSTSSRGPATRTTPRRKFLRVVSALSKLFTGTVFPLVSTDHAAASRFLKVRETIRPTGTQVGGTALLIGILVCDAPLSAAVGFRYPHGEILRR